MLPNMLTTAHVCFVGSCVADSRRVWSLILHQDFLIIHNNFEDDKPDHMTELQRIVHTTMSIRRYLKKTLWRKMCRPCPTQVISLQFTLWYPQDSCKLTTKMRKDNEINKTLIIMPMTVPKAVPKTVPTTSHSIAEPNVGTELLLFFIFYLVFFISQNMADNMNLDLQYTSKHLKLRTSKSVAYVHACSPPWVASRVG